MVLARGTWREARWGERAATNWDRCVRSFTYGYLGVLAGLVVFMILTSAGDTSLAWGVFGIVLIAWMVLGTVSVVSMSTTIRAVHEHYGIDKRERPLLRKQDMKTVERFDAWVVAHGQKPTTGLSRLPEST